MVDFIFIGPSKTASTWIYEAIRPHPGLFVPAAKDIYFFDKYYAKGEAWYEGFFGDAPSGSLCGELSHDYFFNPAAIERIHAFDSAVKLICCLRNPFERAYSSYLHQVRLGMFAGSFEDALEKISFIVDEGKYHTNLSHIFSLFGREAVLILDFDELEADPARFARRIFNFLGVDETFVPAVLHEKVNPARDARSVTLARMAKRSALLLRHLGGANLLGRLKHSRFINWLMYRQAAPQGSKGGVRYPEQLVRLYHEELEGLSALLHADYSKWRVARLPDYTG
jgi:hypothetical protein